VSPVSINRGVPPGRRDHRKRTDDVSRERNLAIGVPRAAAWAPRICQALHRAAGDIDRF
jgi:hypothetical protein